MRASALWRKTTVGKGRSLVICHDERQLSKKETDWKKSYVMTVFDRKIRGLIDKNPERGVEAGETCYRGQSFTGVERHRHPSRECYVCVVKGVLRSYFCSTSQPST